MSNKDNFVITLEKVRQIYVFLTEKEPTPDDEIEAREELVGHFRNLINLNKDPANSEIISEIFSDLQEWDTLELWFSETSLPGKVAQLLNLPEHSYKSSEPSITTESMSKTEDKEDSEIDLTDIFNKVSEQFQGEIESLKGKIENLKQQLEQKDEKLKTITEKKRVQKVSPKKEVKLSPPKIKIPIIKKSIQVSQSKPVLNSSHSKLGKIPQKPPSPQQFEKPLAKVDKEKLTSIPSTQDIKKPEPEKQVLKPIPKSKLVIEPIVIEEPKDIPIVTEKRKITSIISENQSKRVEETIDKPAPFSIDKPKISSVTIEEIEHESIKSTSSDLFDVFSSIGSKTSEKVEEKASIPIQKTDNPIENFQSKKAEIISEPKNVSTFINFNDGESKSQSKKIMTPQEELITDKDSLYQELIALEGKRYAIEKSYKDLDRNYGKGSIADTAYKVQSEKLKVQSDEITSRINTIRRLISSL